MGLSSDLFACPPVPVREGFLDLWTVSMTMFVMQRSCLFCFFSFLFFLIVGLGWFQPYFITKPFCLSEGLKA